jgi:hypothetical protein
VSPHLERLLGDLPLHVASRDVGTLVDRSSLDVVSRRRMSVTS